MRRMCAIGGLILAALLTPSAATASTAPEVVEGDRLRLVSVLDERVAADLAPGQRIDWLVDVSATPGEPGRIEIFLMGSGALAVAAEVFRCGVPWEGGACPTGAERLRAESPVPRDGSREPLLRIDADDTARLLLTVTAPDDPREGARSELRVLAEGFGEEVGAGPPDDDGGDGLATTGGAPLWAVCWGALGAVGVGAALTAARRDRRERA
ncbi:hypothetical protein [Microbacterium karelineae]|uniref:hypothetical protein n=1 Tax=Microbacterium karelineae TaxID=2654283 RepID=UPI0012E9EF55|nr:hypothetical protein [Microbacterium karelineae]